MPSCVRLPASCLWGPAPTHSLPPPAQRDARQILLFSALTVVDEVNRPARRCRVNTHLGLTYLSFLEALARLAASHGCPPGLPLSVLASDAAAAAGAVASLASPPHLRKPGSAGKKKRGGGAGESGDDKPASPGARAATSPSSRGSRGGGGGRRAGSRSPTHADADFGDVGFAYGLDEGPVAPLDLPSRLELLLVHIGVVENYNIVRARRAPTAAVPEEGEP